MLSQHNRPMKMTTTLDETDLVVHRYSGSEAISSPFEFRVGMLSENVQLDIKSLLQTSATIALIVSPEATRYINGKWREIKQVEVGKENLAVYEGLLVPSLWFLSLISDCKIFQNMTVPDIVSQVLKDSGVQDFKVSLQKTYPSRDYCVQYRETNLNFVSRLMEDEGIFYFFEHTASKHTLVLADDPSAIQDCPGQANVNFSPQLKSWTEDDGITSLEPRASVYTGKVSLTDYNFETPRNSLMVTVGQASEYYDYPGDFTENSEGERITRLRLEERELNQSTAVGNGRCRLFVPGYRFRLKDHFRDDANIEYTLVSVQHTASDVSYFAANKTAEPFSFENSFQVIPQTTPFRPIRSTPKPVIRGVQTALVVGKSGEEIWVDSYGRVKVQFYWDRIGTKDENSSCWVRVSQIWAGKGWGWISLPRIGQEVIVDFLEGDPDRPIITGRVYNSDQVTPYTLPDNQTQTGIKTRSSKQGDTSTFNEIRFEDKKGSEELFIHAEKDMTTEVENNDSQSVSNNRTITVEGTHTETITKDTTIEIKEGNYSMTIDQGNETRTIKQGNQSITLNMGNQTVTLDQGNISVKCSLGSITMEAMQSITLKVGENSVVISQQGVTVKGLMVQITGQTITQVSGQAILTLKGGITMIN